MIPEEAIRMRSYLIWQRAGCPDGKALEHWLRAKDELEAEDRPPLQQSYECEWVVMPRLPILRPPRKLTSTRIPVGEWRISANAARR
jgi:hypothetical protein